MDHHSGEYTEQQRADLQLVLAFNRRLSEAIDACHDVSEVEALLDPDPMRYMWVDEGAGRLPEFIRAADEALERAPVLAGHRRAGSRAVGGSGAAARPAVAVAADGRVLHTWIEWEKDVGERVFAVVAAGPEAEADADPVALTGEPADCFRPTALFDRAGRAWVCFARADDSAVSVWARRYEGGRWLPEELVSTTEHPSFNQEAVAHADGTVEVCWQGRTGGRFGIYSRRWKDGTWSDTRLVSDGSAANVWDPSAAALPGGTAYAWTEYHNGSYRIVVRRIHDDGTLSDIHPISSGSDYALHPSLAATPDGGVWCAFDVVTVHGHGGSGPTRLRATAELAEPFKPEGMRESGDAVPPELLPEIAASLRVVRVDEDGVAEAEGELAPETDIVPGGLPRLVADAQGGLTLAYRIHRRLPLMTYYWEVATQTLGPDGWSAPTTYAGSDGTMEEVALAPLPDGALVSWQADGRKERGLTWTEGFGGRECPFLLEHQGEVIWHSMHGSGTIRSAVVPGSGGPARAVRRLPVVHSALRREARTWVAAERDRYRTSVGDRDFSLYWGDLHRHSLISRCTSGDEPSLEDFYRYSWDICEYDFWAVTDHSENSSEYQWWNIQKIADLFRIDDRFIPLYGFEWTGMTGHQNVIFGSVERGAPIYSSYAEGSATPAELWSKLRGHPDFPAITIPHHPGSAMVPFDWDYYDPEAMRLVEVFQACRGNYEDDGCFRQYSDGTLPGTFVADGLRRGYRYGLIASSDHGHGASYVGAYAERLDRQSVFEALHARRVFAATTRDIVVDFRIGDTFMGGETRTSGPVELEAYVRGYGEIARIDVVRGGETVHVLAPDPQLPAGWTSASLRLEWGRGHSTTDWSGSLAIEGGKVLQTPYWSPEITEAGEQSVSWSAMTKSFGEPYGAQRGGIELTLLGPDDAVVRVKTAHGELTTTLGKVRGTAVELPVDVDGRFHLQPGVGGLTGLGGGEQRLRWTDQIDRPTWYYIRAYQTDGEMAWSSPIWVDLT
ncbi:hypothetical protein AAW14_24905 [Streptomyces hygroscopicus]|uniref:hypothetical protein n=1 Tax=Streptomyces hygroscopicus TaxID=1912 RepID=UPI0022407C06|nr:hypothetical protein [Streptomyces hygroscopicus]MCW7945162.1 hypothetical protein [Streptomyces hygroscopicus]